MYKLETPYKQNRTILQKQEKKQSVHIADNRRTMFDCITRISPTVENKISKTIQKVGTNYRLSIEIAGSGNETIHGNKGIAFASIGRIGTLGHVSEMASQGHTDLVYQIQGPSECVGGIFDAGPNSIENISLTLLELIESVLRKDNGNVVYIDIKGHSRGTVAISFLLDKIEQSKLRHRIVINSSIQYDPVPGQTFSTAEMNPFSPDVSPYYKKTIFKHRIGKSAVIYSLYTQYGKEKLGTTKNSFVPQTVLGTDIVILEMRNHSVGLTMMEEFKDLTLAPGVYIRDETNQLTPIVSIRDFDTHMTSGLIHAYHDSQIQKGQIELDEREQRDRLNYQEQRYDVIRQVVYTWFYLHNVGTD